MKVLAPHRAHAAWWAFLVHRVSGLALAVFVPLHFFALGQALHGETALDNMLRWTAHPLLKLAETLLIIALAAHLAGGLRLMAFEFLGWNARRKSIIALTGFAALTAGLLFVFNANQP